MRLCAHLQQKQQLLLAGLFVSLAGCTGGAPDIAAPQPSTRVAASSAPTAASASPASSTASTAVVAAASAASSNPPSASPLAVGESPVDARTVELTEVTPHFTSLRHGPSAPCDFHRLYRGAIGKEGSKTALSVWLRFGPGETLSGQGHYDRALPALKINGVASPSTRVFRFEEVGGGRFEGRCNDEGELTGSFVLKGKKQPFKLGPWPASWPPVYQLRRKKITPSGPPPFPSCALVETGIRFFGGTAVSRQASNRALTSKSFADELPAFRTCEYPPTTQQYSSTLMFHSQDVVTIGEYASLDPGTGGPIHSGFNGTKTVDLKRGRVLKLSDIVTDISKLRPMLDLCLRDYFAVHPREGQPRRVTVKDAYKPMKCNGPLLTRHLWDCPDNRQTEPMWGIAPDGIAILASVQRSGPFGPVVSWAALKRAGLLKTASPVRRLWQDVNPAKADVPSCRSAYDDEALFRWKLVSAGLRP